MIQILGIGNSILTDDSAGLRVIEKLRQDSFFDHCILTDGGTGGLGIIDLLEASDTLILVDAFITDANPGTIHIMGIDDLDDNRSVHLCTAHGFDFKTIFELFKKTIPKKAPSSVIIYGIEAKNVTTFSESCSTEVSAAIEEVVDRIRQTVKNDGLIAH